MRISKAVSYVFHPLLMLSYLFLVFMLFVPRIVEPLPSEKFWYVFLLVFISTFFLPLMSIFMLKANRFISSFEMSHRRQRIIPFTFITVFYAISSYFFLYRLHVNQTLSTILTATTLLILFITLITIFYQISVHSAAAMGVFGYMLGLYQKFFYLELFYPMISVLLISGIIMSARLKLNTHTPLEVYSGAVSGLFFGYFSIFWFA